MHSRAGADRYLEEAVLPQLDKFVSEEAFERICQDWLLRRLDDAAEAGSWWGQIRRREEGALRSRTYEADAVAIDADGAVTALGSCKWADRETPAHQHPTAELAKLETIRAELNAPEAQLYFFDRVAFSPRLRELEAERDDVHLVLADELGDRVV